MPVYPDPSRTNGSAWRWKPVDIVVIVAAFAVWWPLGLVALAWKIWNDRQPVPVDLGEVLQAWASRVQSGVDSLWTAFSAAPAAGDTTAAPTGNAAFDAHVREELDRLAAERRKLDDEIAAFRAFLAQERSGDRDLYERFRATRR